MQPAPPFKMQFNDFENIVLPILHELLLPEDASLLSRETGKKRWLASAPFHNNQNWEERYAACDAKDALLSFHPSLLEACCIIRRNYDELRRMKEAGCVEARIAISKKCVCLADVDGKRISVNDALKAFETCSNTIRMLLTRTEPCTRSEDPQMCDVQVVSIPVLDKELTSTLLRN